MHGMECLKKYTERNVSKMHRTECLKNAQKGMLKKAQKEIF
jgi:hypothetical protein